MLVKKDRVTNGREGKKSVIKQMETDEKAKDSKRFQEKALE